jgi:two-component system sensor histidine kinase UhpB
MALSSRVSKQGGIQVERDLSSQLPELSEDVELVVYRIAQEALTNVLRHSRASRCRVRLAAEGDRLALEVVDNGVGMPASLGDETIGVEGMRERALLVGGRLTIGPGASGGTVVSLEIPLEEGA